MNSLRNAYNAIFPEGFSRTFKEDLSTLYAYSKLKMIRAPKGEEELAVEGKVVAAAYRVIAGSVMITGLGLGAKIILPIFNAKFCVGSALAAAAYVIGRDVFKMAKTADINAYLPLTWDQFKNYLRVERKEMAKNFAENTILNKFWKTVLLK